MPALSFEKLASQMRLRGPKDIGATVQIYTDTDVFTGKGRIHIQDGELELKVVLDGEKPLPEIVGALPREKLWRLGGVIENQIPFCTVGFPHRWFSETGRFHVLGADFSIFRIRHITNDRDEGGIASEIQEVLKWDGFDGGYADEGLAVLRNYKLLDTSSFTSIVELNPFLGESRFTRRDTLKGRLPSFEYACIQRGTDVEVRIRALKGERICLGQLKTSFKLLLDSLAFIHGEHAWPEYYRISESGRVLEEWIAVHPDLSRNRYLPIPASLSSEGDSQIEAIECMVRCVLDHTDFGVALDDFLFLSREAGASSTPYSVGTLAFCAVLEGLVKLLFERFIVFSADEYAEGFSRAKGIVVACIEACQSCSQSCSACADSCLSEDSVSDLTRCVREVFS